MFLRVLFVLRITTYNIKILGTKKLIVLKPIHIMIIFNNTKYLHCFSLGSPKIVEVGGYLREQFLM